MQQYNTSCASPSAGLSGEIFESARRGEPSHTKTRTAKGSNYLALKVLSPTERASLHPLNFDHNGNIRMSRKPCGDPVIVQAHDLLWIVVWKRRVILNGEELENRHGWGFQPPLISDDKPALPSWISFSSFQTRSGANDTLPVWSHDGRMYSTGMFGFQYEWALHDRAFQPYSQIVIIDADGSNKQVRSDSIWEDSMPLRLPNSALRSSPKGTHRYWQLDRF